MENKELNLSEKIKLNHNKDFIRMLDVYDVAPCMCPHCGLDLDLHDGSGFCPGGTEEQGGRR